MDILLSVVTPNAKNIETPKIQISSDDISRSKYVNWLTYVWSKLNPNVHIRIGH
ncbi:hypothetical protein ACTXT7_001418 [Hymenolepis weldensis]